MVEGFAYDEAAALVRDWIAAGPSLQDAYDSPANRLAVVKALEVVWGKRARETVRRCRRCGLPSRLCVCPPTRRKKIPLYRDFEAGVVAVCPPRGVVVEVAAVVPCYAYVRRLCVPAVLCRHFRIASFEVCGTELLRRPPISAELFSDRLETPPFMFRARRRGWVRIRILKVTDDPVSFAAKVVGAMPVRPRRVRR